MVDTKKVKLSCTCPACGISSSSVKEYGVRLLQHYIVGESTVKTYTYVGFRCLNADCKRKTFRSYANNADLDDLRGRSRYTESSKRFMSHKFLTQQLSYQGLHQSIQSDFGNKTAASSLYTWVQQQKVSKNELPSEISVLHTDEKHPSKKKQKSNTKYVIASAGRCGKESDSQALHANLADSNGKEAIENHYKTLIENGLNADKIALVVTDMLASYTEVIPIYFPNALHQYCVFHFIQSCNKYFKQALKAHRHANFKKAERKEAHTISFLLLKGEEKLNAQERETVYNFCEKHPTVAADYAFKEDIRTLYATADTLAQAYAFKDIINDQYTNEISVQIKKAMLLLNTHFDKTVAYLHQGFFRDKTNNDAERMMRTIKRTQQTHYFLRKSENYIRKIRTILRMDTPSAA